jgi:hypothetical protein
MDCLVAHRCFMLAALLGPFVFGGAKNEREEINFSYVD